MAATENRREGNIIYFVQPLVASTKILPRAVVVVVLSITVTQS